MCKLKNLQRPVGSESHPLRQTRSFVSNNLAGVVGSLRAILQIFTPTFVSPPRRNWPVWTTRVLGSTPHPTELFMDQVTRMGTAADDGLLVRHRVLIWDRDRKWSHAVRGRFADAGVRLELTPERTPNANAYVDCFPVDQGGMSQSDDSGGGATLRHALTEFVEHYHRERNHQGLDKRLIAGPPAIERTSRVRCRARLGGLRNFYERAT